MEIRPKVEEASIEITVTRANGKVENLGTVSYYHKNPLRRYWFNVKSYLKKLKARFSS